MNTRPSIIRANEASTLARSFPMSAATAAMVGILPRVLIERAIAIRTSRSTSASVIRDVLHELELVVAGRTGVAHASLLHDAAGRDVLGEADRDDLALTELAEAVVEARASRFGRQTPPPPFLREVVRDLDLRTPSFDVDEAAVTDELTCRAQLDGPETEAVLTLVTDEALDRAACALERRRRAARDETHRLLVAEHALVQHFGVADLERADDQPRRFDRERQRVRDAIGCRLCGHGALSIGSAAQRNRPASAIFDRTYATEAGSTASGSPESAASSNDV